MKHKEEFTKEADEELSLFIKDFLKKSQPKEELPDNRYAKWFLATTQGKGVVINERFERRRQAYRELLRNKKELRPGLSFESRQKKVCVECGKPLGVKGKKYCSNCRKKVFRKYMARYQKSKGIVERYFEKLEKLPEVALEENKKWIENYLKNQS